MADPKIAPPRVIIELQPDGRYAMEYYINGARTRELLDNPLERGWDFGIQVYGGLSSVAQSRRQEANRKAEREAKVIATRHVRVWHGVADSFGKHFAEKTVGPLNPGKAADLRAAQANTIISSEDLL